MKTKKKIKNLIFFALDFDSSTIEYCCCNLMYFFFLYFLRCIQHTFTSFSLKPIKRNDFGRLHSDTYGCLTPHTTDRAWIIINDIIMFVCLSIYTYVHRYMHTHVSMLVCRYSHTDIDSYINFVTVCPGWWNINHVS